MIQQPTLFDGGRHYTPPVVTVSRNRWIMEARYIAAQIAMEKGMVSSDDVQAVHPLPPYLDPNTWGAVLRQPYFRRFDAQRSKRPEARGRWVHTWLLNSKDTSWMQAVEASS